MLPKIINVSLGLVIFFLLITLLIPFILRLNQEQDNRITINNFKQVIISIHSCNDMHRRLPPAFDSFGKLTNPASLHVHLLPFLEEETLYKSFLSQGKGFEQEKVKLFCSPLDASSLQGKGVQNYAANLRVFATKGLKTKSYENLPSLAEVEPGDAKIPRDFLRGTSNTIVFATKYAECGEGGSRYAANPTSPFAAFFGQNAAQTTAHPSEPRATFQQKPKVSECLCSPLMPQSFHKKGLMVGLADASVRTLGPSLDPGYWNELLCPSSDY
jgi:hypothetical protein